MKKINKYGMQSGIVKVVPPSEWHAVLPALDEAVKTIRVKEPIKQDIMGTSGTYRQANIVHQRSYNLPQWRQLCEQSDHQPPAKRGERRANREKIARSTPKTKAAASTPSTASSKRRGRPPKGKGKGAAAEDVLDTPDRLPTPISPKADEDSMSLKPELAEDEEELSPTKGKGGRQPKAISVSSRRKYNRREATAKVDEAAFKDFKYRLETDEYTPERCEELERAYWKTLTYAPPLYGADMPGTLFDERTTSWNLGRLENLLDVIGTHIPGVNTAYLYLGMWKATFAWHLEDVDLYSINYLHFGAPKQWYSISQKDARRFEAAMKSVWPTDAKACDQFLRHKTFLISPSHLLQNFNIQVNKVVSYPGEFVITFPYGYHSGYNLGYNCAEAVNFALDDWLEYGRVAKRCDCSQAQDSVWIDVHDIELKLRGEETDYEETDDDEEDEDDEQGPMDLPTPPQSIGDVKPKAPRKKRKRAIGDKGDKAHVKRIRLRIKAPTKEPCILCPNDIPSEPLLPTEDGRKAHRMCALYIPETSIDSGAIDVVTDVPYIDKARLELKCNYCRSKKGACFQCSQKKCTRAYHPTCAAAAGVFVEQGEMPVFGEDGTEYKEWAIEFSCRFHRTKRDKKYEGDALEENERIRKTAAALKIGETCQMQYYRGDIFAGVVIENRKSEETIVVDILPRGYVIDFHIYEALQLANEYHRDRVEVEYKWILVPDPAEYHIPKPSANAIPMPKSRKAKQSLNTTKRLADDLPRADDPFVRGCTWAEFKTGDCEKNTAQIRVDLSKENQIWYYLGKTSTEAKAQFTEDPARPRHNPKGHFLDSIPKPMPKVTAYPARNTPKVNQHALNAASISKPVQSGVFATKSERPYVYKPRDDAYRIDPQAYRSQQSFLQQSAPYKFGTDPRWQTDSKIAHNVNYATTSRAPQSSTKSIMAPPAQHRPSTGYTSATQYQSQQAQVTPQQAAAPRPKYNPAGKATPSRPNVFAMYTYLQVEHNRSPLDYKTPYRPGHGFMNGYQGNEDDFRKHAQQTLLEKKSLSGFAGPVSSSPHVSTPASRSSSTAGIPPLSPAQSSMAYGGYGAPSQSKTQAQNSRPKSWVGPSTPDFHSSARRDNESMLHRQYQPSAQPQTDQYRRASYQNPYTSHPSQQQKSYSMAPPLQPGYPYSMPTYSPHDYSRSATEQYHPSSAQQFRHPQYNFPLAQTPGLQSPVVSQFTRPPSSYSQQSSGSHQQYAPNTMYQSEQKPTYAHQQYFQKPQGPTQPSARAPHPTNATQMYKQRTPDLPDVPVDSTSLIENMMANLRKAAGSARG